MKEKANYPKNNTTTKIDHFLAFRRKAKIFNPPSVVALFEVKNNFLET